MVMPASGYLGGALLRRAAGVAGAANRCGAQRIPTFTRAGGPAALGARSWPASLVRKHANLQFGLEKFDAFFRSRAASILHRLLLATASCPIGNGFLAN